MPKVKTKHQCDKCGNYFSAKAGNYKKHILVCDGNYSPLQKRNDCKFCKVSFDGLNASERANHTRWCDKNPKREKYVDALKNNGGIDKVELMNAARKKSGASNQYMKARLERREVPVSPLKGKPGIFLGKKHTEETKQILSQKALASKHRRLKKGVVEYKGILLDSSWELELAKRLDELKVKWTRPEPMPWVNDQGVTHNYFPDFYLPEYDLFLDPKNSHAIKVQKKKLDCILTQYKNIVIIDSLEKCKTFSP